MIKDIPLTILIDPGATDSFISPLALEKCGLASHAQSDFDQVEMASGWKQSVGRLVKNCIVMIGNVSTKMKLYTTTLGSYDLIVGMDWLESHRALVDCYEKKVFGNNDFGEPIVIEGRKRDISLRFIAATKVKKCMRKGCRIYAVEVMNC